MDTNQFLIERQDLARQLSARRDALALDLTRSRQSVLSWTRWLPSAAAFVFRASRGQSPVSSLLAWGLPLGLAFFRAKTANFDAKTGSFQRVFSLAREWLRRRS